MTERTCVPLSQSCLSFSLISVFGVFPPKTSSTNSPFNVFSMPSPSFLIKPYQKHTQRFLKKHTNCAVFCAFHTHSRYGPFSVVSALHCQKLQSLLPEIHHVFSRVRISLPSSYNRVSCVVRSPAIQRPTSTHARASLGVAGEAVDDVILPGVAVCVGDVRSSVAVALDVDVVETQLGR